MASWWPCCCDTDPCDYLTGLSSAELDITGANIYDTTANRLDGWVVNTYTLGTGVSPSFTQKETCSTACDQWSYVESLTLSPDDHPKTNCGGNQSLSGIGVNEWMVEVCDDGEILIEHHFSAARFEFGLYTRAIYGVTLTIDAADFDGDLLTGSGMDLADAYVTGLWSWSGTWGTPTVTWSCSTATFGEPYDSLTGTLRIY